MGGFVLSFCVCVCVCGGDIYIPFPTPSLFSNSIMFSIDLLGWEFGLCSFKQFQSFFFFFFKFCRLNLDLKCGLDHFQFQYFPLLKFKLIFLLLKTLIFFLLEKGIV